VLAILGNVLPEVLDFGGKHWTGIITEFVINLINQFDKPIY